MNRPVFIGEHATIEAAAAAMAGAVQDWARASSEPVSSVRWEAEVPDTDPLAWLHHHPHLIRMYCSNRERLLQIAAIGVADMLRFKDDATDLHAALDAIFSRLDELPEGVRYYGGMRFHDHGLATDSSWQRFGRVRFVVPSLELIRDDRRSRLCANIVLSDGWRRDVDMLLALLKRVVTPPALPAAHLPMPLNRINLPDRERWEVMMQRALQLLTEGPLEKIVLARRCVFDFGEPLNPMALLQRLREATPDSFHFCFNYGDEIAFIGATPERLYQRHGAHVLSEALAGTRPRGATEEDDRWLESELLASAKERSEHRLVADAITSTLRELGGEVDRHAAPEVLKLSHVQHLRTLIRCTLPRPVSDADLLLALHPTPAVGEIGRAHV